MKLREYIGEATAYDKKVMLERGNPVSWLKSVSAFANTLGGKLLFGVGNEGDLVGLADAEKDAEDISEAVDECIVNALIHRDYLEIGSEIHVDMFDDRLEIVSPGGLVREMTLEDARNGFSKLRNFGIGAALEYMKEVEGWGGGVSRYFESCEKLGLPPPMVEEMAGFVRVVFWRKLIAANGGDGGNRGGNGGNRGGNGDGSAEDVQARILAGLRGDSKLTVRALVEKTGVAQRTVERMLSELKKSGRLVRHGGTRGYWQIV